MSIPSDFPFPLALEPFEHYMLVDDCEMWPMTVAIRIRMNGMIDRSRLEHALVNSLAHHPLLRAIVKGEMRGPTRKLHWVPHKGSPALVWIKADQPARIDRRLNLEKEAGLRLYVLDRKQKFDVIIQWHHACCDGIGILNFIDSLFRAYHAGDIDGAPGQDDSTHGLDWWKRRGNSHLSLITQCLQSPHQIARVVKFFSNSTVPLATEECEFAHSPHWDNDEFCSYAFSRDETSKILRLSRKRGVTLNDLVLAKFYNALMEWNLGKDTDLQGKNIRIAIPINLRSTGTFAEPAVNQVSMVFLDRNESQIRNLDGLLGSLSREMQNVKRWHTGWALIHVLKIAGLLSKGMPRIVETGGPSVTSVLSNLGQVFVDSPLADESGRIRMADLVVERIEPFAPIRKGVVAAVDVLTYARQLTFTLNFDRTIMSRSSAKDLLHLYVDMFQRE